MKAILSLRACVILILAFSSLAPLAGEPRTRSAALSLSSTDDDYVVALATANRFLQAWQTRDPETGILMLADSLKQHTSEDYLQAFFSPEGSVQGYEISHGKKIASGRYSFPVAVFEHPEGNRKGSRPRSSNIVVVRNGADDWTVDKLP